MVPEELARQSLTADAAYCAALGAGSVALAPKVGRWLEIPTPVVALAGLGEVAWGGWVALAAGSSDWRMPTKVVLAANTTAAAGLGVLAGTRRGRGAKTALAIVALKVGAFAGVQAAALVWDRKGHIGTEESAPAAVGTEDSTAVGGEESADS